ncbi:nucleoside/nucleotide kinase family protein [Aurantimonas sp. Leaf443]|uniref:nucleoside/nucleotide kinase family protein n=1 Tax=Aurantimonas sp. Leaf443 TaxID=1736378 RepID=UPI0006FDE70F|nr:nucleoside/nucleotide kinase family protein [Aurantimonas sp. Leaf443]KQT88206.1 nucleoside triphosphate hydrolase [Aurantimonas sp. Leaf443]
MIRTDLAGLAAALLALPGETRHLVAVAGAPGSGKTTFTERLAAALNEARPGCAAVVAMDGFHYDDRVLEARGHRPRKGAPHTFDVDGLASLLDRLRADDGRAIAVPVFDRDLEIARAGARIVDPAARLVLVEGNYLLLDDPAWTPLRPRFDASVLLDVPAAILEERLTRRWQGYGLEGETMRQKMEGNDLPNMRLVLERSAAADYAVENF